MTGLARRLAVARGDEPADVVIAGGSVLSVFTREWLRADVAIADGWVAAVGTGYHGRETIDATGMWVAPGLIDAHVHIESSRLLPAEFARLVLPHGTTTVVADPHEIANVLGTDGVHWLLDSTEGLPLDVFFMASSCVPASAFESPRRALTPGDLEGLLRRRRVLGLAEMMNFPGVIAGDPAELAKLGVFAPQPRCIVNELRSALAHHVHIAAVLFQVQQPVEMPLRRHEDRYFETNGAVVERYAGNAAVVDVHEPSAGGFGKRGREVVPRLP